MASYSAQTSPKQLQTPHKLQLDGRQKLSVTGVLEVESFDDTMIALRTTQGPMMVRGQELHLQQLSPDGGEILLNGAIDSIVYDEEPVSGGFFARLFG